ncbi:MAG TPA: hypothetical protein VGM16_12290 [Gammaproteobacteria bacterium]|jgi:hypothetical protein
MSQRVLTLISAITLVLAFAAAVGADELSEASPDLPYTTASSAAPAAGPQVSKTALMRE